MDGDSTGSRRSALRWLIGGGVAAAVSKPTSVARAAEEEIGLDAVPKPVMAAAKRILPKADWLSALKLTEQADVVYELDGSDGLDRDVTILVTKDGKVVEFETQLKNPANVPEKVLAAARKHRPHFTPTETHLIRQGKDLRGADDGDHIYDMRGTIAKGREMQVQVTADGEVLEQTDEIPLEKVPVEVTDALKRARPKFEIGTAYALREGRELVGYHFEGQGPAGRDRTISVTPDGKQVEVVEQTGGRPR